jgi:hypothetical protein
MDGLINKAMGGGAPGQVQRPEAAANGVPTFKDVANSDETPDINEETDPAYQAAIQSANEILYKAGAAEDIARSLKTAPDLVEAMANTAYDIVGALDEKTEGQIPDELISSLAVEILTEVADIAEAAGVPVTSAIVGEAVKQMMIRYVTDNGGDSTALKKSFDGIDTNKIGAAIDAKQGR